MRYFRLYFMHPQTGHIIRFVEFDAADDEVAMGMATVHAGENPLELWCERRRVAHIAPEAV